MYPEKCDWLPYDDTLTYSLSKAYLDVEPRSLLIFHARLPERVAVCYKFYEVRDNEILVYKKMSSSALYCYNGIKFL